jgi:hypothetical protein
MTDTFPTVLVRAPYDPQFATTHPRHLSPPLDLKYVQAAGQRRDGRPAPLIDGWLNEAPLAQWVDRVRAHDAKAAVIKGATPSLNAAATLARALKERGVFTVGVGQQVSHVRSLPDPAWQAAFDAPLLGDPEVAAPELLARLAAGEPAAALAAEFRGRFQAGETFVVADPDALPWPQFSPEELRAYPFPFPLGAGAVRRWGYALSSWGCPCHCRHCSAVVRKTAAGSLIKRHPARFIDEVSALVAAGAQAVFFEDDGLLFDRRHFFDVCAEIQRRRLKFLWIANARPPELDEETIAQAAAAGAKLFKIGVESGSPRVIEALGKHPSGEDWIARARRAFPLIRRRGIRTVAMFMVGNPDETADEIERSIALARELAPDYLQVQIFSAYPDVRMFPEIAAGARRPADLAHVFHYAAPATSPSRIPAADLPATQARFYRRFYLRGRYVLSHFHRFWTSYLTSFTTLEKGWNLFMWLLAPAAPRDR